MGKQGVRRSRVDGECGVTELRQMEAVAGDGHF